MAVNVTVTIAVDTSTAGIEVLAEGDDALAGSSVRLADILPRLKLEIGQIEMLAEQVKIFGLSKMLRIREPGE